MTKIIRNKARTPDQFAHIMMTCISYVSGRRNKPLPLPVVLRSKFSYRTTKIQQPAFSPLSQLPYLRPFAANHQSYEIQPQAEYCAHVRLLNS